MPRVPQSHTASKAVAGSGIATYCTSDESTPRLPTAADTSAHDAFLYNTNEITLDGRARLRARDLQIEQVDAVTRLDERVSPIAVHAKPHATVRIAVVTRTDVAKHKPCDGMLLRQ